MWPSLFSPWLCVSSPLALSNVPSQGVVDQAFTTAINAAILIVAAAAFYYTESGGPSQVADLASAHELLTRRVGVGSGYIFAIALLVAGQAASITVTLAGQIVSEGFIAWHTRPVVRRLVTRLIGILPSAIVAASVGPKGVDDLLVGSQVALSLVLPSVASFSPTV
jgi:metal iron transporter